MLTGPLIPQALWGPALALTFSTLYVVLWGCHLAPKRPSEGRVNDPGTQKLYRWLLLIN